MGWRILCERRKRKEFPVFRMRSRFVLFTFGVFEKSES